MNYKLKSIACATSKDLVKAFNKLGVNAAHIISIVYNNQYILFYGESRKEFEDEVGQTVVQENNEPNDIPETKETSQETANNGGEN